MDPNQASEFTARPRKRRSWIQTVSVIIFTLLALALYPSPARADIFVVDRTDDDPAAKACTATPNDCSLRGAIIAANENLGFLDTITLPAGTYQLDQVGTGEGAALNGDLDVNSDLSIVGDGSDVTTIDGNGGVTGERVFTFFGSYTVDITGVTITGGATTSGGAILGFGPLTLTDVVVNGNSASSNGGGIYTVTSLTMDNCEISSNNASNGGGGIYAHNSVVTITNSTLTDNHALGTSSGGALSTYSINGSHVLAIEDTDITNNTAASAAGAILSNNDTVMLTRVTLSGNEALSGSGGGIYKSDGSSYPGLMHITDSTIDGNTAAGAGGGIYIGVYSSVVIAGSTISGNIANTSDAFDGGGGIKQTGPSLIIRNSTISGNSAANHGGGILTYAMNADLTLTNVTVTDNTADSDSAGGGEGGGIYPGYGPVSLENTIIANNSGVQCSTSGGGAITSAGHNISSDATCNLTGTGDQTNTDPLLGPLEDNLGPTDLHALLPGSPAIDAANTAACMAFDQRDWPRPIGPECDIGAYEAPLWIWMPLILR